MSAVDAMFSLAVGFFLAVVAFAALLYFALRPTRRE